MNDFFIYSLQTLLLQFFFLVVFELLFKKETFFKVNRLYLIGSIILSLIIPLLKISIEEKVQQQYVFQLKEIVLSNVTFVENQISKSTLFTLPNLAYLTGFVFFMLLFINKLIRIFKIKQNAILEVIERTKIYRIQNSKQAFSFFNYIFIGNENSNLEAIIKHEKVHQKQLHSLDLLLLESLKIVFWFNPLLYLFQKRIVEIHEFEADFYSVSENKKSYYETLICQIFEVNSISLTNNFYNQSLIKKRIVMLQKSKSKKAGMMKYLVVVPMTVLFLMLFSTSVIAQVKNEAAIEKKKEKILKEIKEYNHSVTQEEKIKIIDNNEITDNDDNVLSNDYVFPFEILENPPLFPDCDNKTGKEAKDCFIEKMNQHVRENFIYPAEAKKENIKGKVSVLLTIEVDGKSSCRVRGPKGCELLEEEAKRIMNLLPTFIPGEKEGKKVVVTYAIPIMFALAKEESKTEE